MKIILTHIQGSRTGQKEEFEGPIVRVGRDPKDCDLVFDSFNEPGVSRVHAEISVSEGLFYLEDLNSRNGTYLDAVPIKGKVKIESGCLIQFGVEGPTLRFEFDASHRAKVPNTQPVLTVGPQARALADQGTAIACCRSCGAELIMPVKFCRRCGKPIEPAAPAFDPEISISEALRKGDSETLVGGAPVQVRKCYSCSKEIMGDPRFCPACGAVLSPDSRRLHSDDLADFNPPPAATAYVSLGKIDPPVKQDRVSRLFNDEDKAREQPRSRPLPRTPQRLPEKAPEKRLSSGGKIELPRVQRPGPLIPPASSSAAKSASGSATGLTPPPPTLMGMQNPIYEDQRQKPSSPGQTLLLSAQALSKKGHISQAIEECERAIRLDAQLPEAYNFLGQLLLAQGESEKAIAALEKALRLKPTMAEAYTNLGKAYLRAGRYEEAAVSAREAIKIDHVIPDAYYTIGQALIEIGDYDRAFEAFTRALRVRPDYAEAQLGLATVQFRCGQADEAINNCQLAIKKRSDFPQAYCLLGQLYRAKGQIEEAAKALHEAIRLKPDYAIAYNYLALNYRTQGKHEEALAACRRAMEIDANLAEARNTLGLIHCDRGQYKQGMVEYKLALSIRPKYAEAHNNLGLCYFKTGDFDSAIAAFERAIEIEPHFVLARFNLALCYFKKQDRYGVKKQYEVLREVDEARAAKLYQKIKSLL